jgi:hypothetical protein
MYILFVPLPIALSCNRQHPMLTELEEHRQGSWFGYFVANQNKYKPSRRVSLKKQSNLESTEPSGINSQEF